MYVALPVLVTLTGVLVTLTNTSQTRCLRIQYIRRLGTDTFLLHAQGKSSQNRLETFFGAATVVSSTVGKRKALEKSKGGKDGKGGGNVGGKKSKGVTKRK